LTKGFSRVLFSTVLAVFFAISAAAGQSVPRAGHVFVVMEENHGYSSVIGSSAMPYLNSLAQKYGLATQYYADTHPSIGNYFELTTGQILSNDDSRTPANFPVSADNIVRHFIGGGVTWKSYAESLPSTGYTGTDVYPYVVHHNPFAYFTDVQNSSSEKLNLVPFTQFHTDLANGTLPQFSYIIPNLLDDAHDGTFQAADSWLQTNIAPVLANSAFQNNGLMVIVFDEAADTDTTNGGGRVAMLVLSPLGKSGYQSTTLYQHQSTLRMTMEALGVASFPGSAATAADPAEFFGASTTTATNPTPTPTPTPSPTPTGPCASAGAGVTVCSPASGSSAGSPVTITAVAQSASSSPITAMRIYDNNSSVYLVNAASINTSLAMAAGAHNVVVQAWDAAGAVYKKAVSLTISGTSTTSGGTTSGGTSPTAPCTSSALNTVAICAPASASSSGSPVYVSAAGSSQYTITAMQIYVDYSLGYQVSGSSISTNLALGSGTHRLDIKAWTTAGTSFMSTTKVTVP
jgi:hypothetical protein